MGLLGVHQKARSLSIHHQLTTCLVSLVIKATLVDRRRLRCSSPPSTTSRRCFTFITCPWCCCACLEQLVWSSKKCSWRLHFQFQGQNPKLPPVRYPVSGRSLLLDVGVLSPHFAAGRRAALQMVYARVHEKTAAACARQ